MNISTVLIFLSLFTLSKTFTPTKRSVKVISGVTKTTTNCNRVVEQVKSKSTCLKAGKEICVLGGGFGGLNTALTLSNLPWPNDQKPNITLVDNKERFVFLPLLYELCVGDATLEEVAPTFDSLLANTGIQFIKGNVYGIDKNKDLVYIHESKNQDAIRTIKYDSLVIATGAGVDLDMVSGAKELALPFYTLDNCLELRKRLTLLDSIGGNLEREIRVVILGGGYSGVELALNMKERLSNVGKGVHVTIVQRSGEILQYATDYNKKIGKDRLDSAGIYVKTNKNVVEVLPESDSSLDMQGRCKVVIQDNQRDGCDIIQDEVLDADILLWTAGTMSKNIQRGILNSELPRDAKGRIVVGPYLQVKGCKNTFALGDCSRSKKIYGATAAVAMQQASYAAWNVYASVMNDDSSENIPSGDYKMLPFQYISLGEMLTLGGEDASISSMGIVELNGASASILRRLVYAVRMPTAQQALTAAISSLSKRFEIAARKGSEKAKNPKKIIEWR
jgi:NADH dehydrogenase